MTLDQLESYTKDFIKDYPQHRDELVDLFFLAKAEIDSEEPEHSECEKAFYSMQEVCGEA